jgi:Asp-tRNA(Asn)/Glu-tRNA(Gln) amidotransferase A subunit family amidase
VTRVEAALRAIEARADLNAVITACDDASGPEAQAAAGPLAGVPLLVKDLFDTAGVRTTYGSAIYAEHVPAETAPAVARLQAAGAVVVGKGNLDEFAWGVAGQNEHWGDVVNPRRPDLIAGGSSAGNAAALAAGLCDLALGSDTGGSIRMPSACCGTVGFKPSYGRVPTLGCFPLCASLDTVGPMARTVAECALAFSVLTGAPAPGSELDGLTVGVLTRQPALGPAETAERDERALAHAVRLERLGARVLEVELPVPESDTWPLFYWEAAESHRATFPSRRDEYGATIRAKLDEAQRVTAAEAAEARDAVVGWRERAATEPAVDLVVSPTLGMDVPPVGVSELEVRLPLSAYTRPFNYLGWAAMAIGDLQLAGRDDATVLAAALAWEDAYG